MFSKIKKKNEWKVYRNEREVRCFAYSPPGCIIDENGLAATKNNVFSIVLGDDIIPRLSFQAYFFVLAIAFYH